MPSSLDNMNYNIQKYMQVLEYLEWFVLSSKVVFLLQLRKVFSLKVLKWKFHFLIVGKHHHGYD